MLDPITLSLQAADCIHPCTCELPDKGLLNLSATFWTSVTYFLAVIPIYFQAGNKYFKLEFWVFAGTLLAGSSMLFHSLYLHGTLALDFASITLALSFFSLYGFAVQKVKKKLILEFGFFGLYFILWLLFLYLSKEYRIGLSVLIFTLSAWEVFHAAHSRKQNKLLYASLLVLFASFSCFVLEEMRIWCTDPISAHSFWHLGSALSLYLYGRWRFVL